MYKWNKVKSGEEWENVPWNNPTKGKNGNNDQEWVMFFGIVASGSMLKTLRTMYNVIFRCAPWRRGEWESRSDWIKHKHNKRERMLHLQVQSSMHFFGLVVFRKVNDSHCSALLRSVFICLFFLLFCLSRKLCESICECVRLPALDFQRFIYSDAHGISFYASILSVFDCLYFISSFFLNKNKMYILWTKTIICSLLAFHPPILSSLSL